MPYLKGFVTFKPRASRAALQTFKQILRHDVGELLRWYRVREARRSAASRCGAAGRSRRPTPRGASRMLLRSVWCRRRLPRDTGQTDFLNRTLRVSSLCTLACQRANRWVAPGWRWAQTDGRHLRSQISRRSLPLEVPPRRRTLPESRRGVPGRHHRHLRQRLA